MATEHVIYQGPNAARSPAVSLLAKPGDRVLLPVFSPVCLARARVHFTTISLPFRAQSTHAHFATHHRRPTASRRKLYDRCKSHVVHDVCLQAMFYVLSAARKYER